MVSIAQNPSKINPQSKIVSHKRREVLSQLNGLVSPAISSQHLDSEASIELKSGGLIARRKVFSSPPKDASPRGVVAGISLKSRRRLREKLVDIDWDAIIPGKGKSRKAVFVTLTYPRDFTSDWQEHKQHLKAWLMRLDRTYPVSGVLWRLEYQRRGAAHYHILVVFARDVNVDRLRKWVSLSWYRVVGSNDSKHLKAGTNVRRLFGPAGKLMRYISKYVSKADSGEHGQTGRMWGVWGQLPIGSTYTVALTRQGWIQFTRYLRRWGRDSRYLSRVTASTSGVLVFGATSQLVQLLRGVECVT